MQGRAACYLVSALLVWINKSHNGQGAHKVGGNNKTFIGHDLAQYHIHTILQNKRRRWLRAGALYVLTIPDNAFWPGDSCLDQPRSHLKFADDVISPITSTISHNFALSSQLPSWRSGCRSLCTSQVIGLGFPRDTFSCL